MRAKSQWMILGVSNMPNPYPKALLKESKWLLVYIQTSLSQSFYLGGTLEIIFKSQETLHKNYKDRLWI
jgi:hypothetical protein